MSETNQKSSFWAFSWLDLETKWQKKEFAHAVLQVQRVDLLLISELDLHPTPVLLDPADSWFFHELSCELSLKLQEVTDDRLWQFSLRWESGHTELNCLQLQPNAWSCRRPTPVSSHCSTEHLHKQKQGLIGDK